MLRRWSGVLLLAILAIAGVVGSSYFREKSEQRRKAPVTPAALRQGLDAASSDWVYHKDNGNCPQWEVRAREMESAGEPASRVFLKKVQLKLFHNCGAKYDFVRSEAADFDKNTGRMSSDGEVEITLAVKNTIAGTVANALTEAPELPGRLLTIRSSGVVVESDSGKVRTDKPAAFQFDLGEGDSVGASYDPNSRELELHSQVHLLWRGKDPDAKPMRIEAGKLNYKETESKVFLTPWAKFQRNNLKLDSANAVVTLEDGNIRLVEAVDARGLDKYPNRHLEFGAAGMHMNLSAKSEVEKITGVGEAKLEMLTDSAKTRVDTEKIELDFEITPDKESLLKTAWASGKTVIDSKPTPREGAAVPPTRVLKADGVLTKMRAGGEEIEAMETMSPGTLDLIPNTAGQPRRQLKAERLWMTYAAKNQLEKFRAVEVATETYKPAPAKPKPGKPAGDPPPALTWSHDLQAIFAPESGEMTRMEQWTRFRYKEGDRQATAEHATLEASTNLITLTRSEKEQARVWDPTGSVLADRIVMNQQSGDFTAEGKVASSRMPDKKPAAAGTNAMLAQDEPVQATAAKMISKDENAIIIYEGDAVLWQTANRLQAHRVIIQRKEQKLAAEGNVVTQFLDKKPNPKSGRQTNTVVRAARMDYDDKEKLAHYQGGVRLLRDDMDSKSRELRAWMSAKQESDSSLERAFGDGDVEIFQTDASGRTRRGTSEHSEYYVTDERVILNGGIARMVDSKTGTTAGKRLTYFANNDTLLVEGAITQPVVSRIRRK